MTIEEILAKFDENYPIEELCLGSQGCAKARYEYSQMDVKYEVSYVVCPICSSAIKISEKNI